MQISVGDLGLVWNGGDVLTADDSVAAHYFPRVWSECDREQLFKNSRSKPLQTKITSQYFTLVTLLSMLTVLLLKPPKLKGCLQCP